jgi:hypothetical protein
MKCIECRCCRKGWYKSKPNSYVCIGVPEPFVISDVNAECTEYFNIKTAEPEIKTEDCLVLGFDRSPSDDACLVISRRNGENIVVINSLYGEKALDVYKKLIGIE